MFFIVYFNISLLLTSNLLPPPHTWSHSLMVSGVCTAWSAINICKRVKKQQFWLAGKRVRSRTTMSARAHASFYREFAEMVMWRSTQAPVWPLHWYHCDVDIYTKTLLSKQQTGMLTYVGLGWSRRRKNSPKCLTSMFYLTMLFWPQGGPFFGCAALSD